MERSTLSRCTRGMLGGLLAALLAAAMPALAEEAPQDPCARDGWILSGAASQPEDGRATYVEAWTATLEVAVACLKSEPLVDACLVVRGLTDELDFNPTLARAFGSREAVQLARGQGRAMAVQARLEALGAPVHRTRLAAAVLDAKARGVELRLVRGCLDPANANRLGRAELEALVDERVTRAIASAAPPTPEQPPQPAAPAPQPPASPPPPPDRWLEASLDLSFLGFEPEAVYAPVLAFAAGLERGGLLWRGAVGLSVGSAREERIGLEASAFGGRRLSPVLEVGVEARYRIASFTPADPWLDQVVGLGARVAYCPGDHAALRGQLCLSADLLPLGVRWRRGEIVGGEAVPIPMTADYAAIVAVGVAVRWPWGR
jgi:hypothetical protein